jgi:putative flavoprotein involved in K+ transport
MEHHDAIVIGGGQAGLAMSRHLQRAGVEHVVLESGRIAETWRSQRWDSFCLVTPNWTMQLPGFAYDGDDPDGFTPRDGVVRYIEQYCSTFGLPVRTGVRVTSIARDEDGGYRLETTSGPMLAGDVVVAAGAFPRPHVLPMSATLAPDIAQLHTVDFKNEKKLAPGAVLVVGSGQSGAQIAEELAEAGRKVFLCVGSCGRIPRRYRGKDGIWWSVRLGITERRVGELADPKMRFACKPTLTGQHGGRDIDLYEFPKKGVTLLGRLLAIDGARLALARDVNEKLGKADAFARKFLTDADAYAAREKLDLPEDATERARLWGDDRPVLAEPESLDLRAEGVTTVVWATGYRPEFPWVHAPVFDAEGHPVHERGVTRGPGLYFLGLAYLHRMRSDTLYGVGEDAAYLAERIIERRAAPRAIAR